MGGPLRLLYVAIDQKVPGTLGGSVHVQAVAEGLARLGHEVHVAETGRRRRGRPGAGAPGIRCARRSAAPSSGGRVNPRSAQLAREVRAEAIIERYYNFGGEGILAAGALGVPAMLEVNAPIVDYPGSSKARLDRALVVEPMRRWRDRICRATDLFVTPTADILPGWVDRDKVLEVEWGADVDRLPAGRARPRPFTRDRERVLGVFAGAFRSWHGVVHLSAALARLHEAGDSSLRRGASSATVPSDRPPNGSRATCPASRSPARCRTTAAGWLAQADIGVAPFDPARHAPLRLGFYWSPLKIFEYMAVGSPGASRRHCRAFGGSSNTGAKAGSTIPTIRAGSIARSKRSPTPIGAASWAPRRARGSSSDFSWTAHCRALDARLRELVPRERPAARADRHRLLPADLRRQRLEHVGAGARPRRARPPRRSRESRRRGRGPACSSAPTKACRVTDFCRPAPNVPVLRNMIKNERLWTSLERRT